MLFKNLEEELRQDMSCKVQRQIDEIEGNIENAKKYASAYMVDQYNAKIYSLEDLQNGAIKCMKKDAQRDLDNMLDKLHAVAEAPDLKDFTCVIDYEAKSWSAKVRAKLTVNDKEGISHNYVGLAGGGGYDRASTAMAAALNQSPSITKLLYEYKERALEEGKSDEDRSSATGRWNRDILAYGTGYNVLPEFEGGVGVGAIIDIFEVLGWKLKEHINTERTSESIYTCTENEG